MEVRRMEGMPALALDAPAKVVSMGPVIEVTTFQRRPKAPPIRKLTRDLYEDTRTGDVKEYVHTANRSEGKDSIRKTLAHIRALINTNVVRHECCRWVTLTYAENMRDQKRLYRDFKSFWKRFLYWCKGQGYGKPEYITVIEPQGRGAWHVHAFFIWDGPAPYIDNDGDMERLWGHGWTTTKAVTDCDNIGAYFSAYLADMPIEEAKVLGELPFGTEIVDKEVEERDGQKLTKKIVKGGRLHLYPPGMNILRRSKGIKDPVEEWMTSQKANEKASVGTLTYSVAFEIVDDTGGKVNTVSKEYYNTKRAKGQ